jgi:hypothetical protein
MYVSNFELKKPAKPYLREPTDPSQMTATFLNEQCPSQSSASEQASFAPTKAQAFRSWGDATKQFKIQTNPVGRGGVPHTRTGDIFTREIDL